VTQEILLRLKRKVSSLTVKGVALKGGKEGGEVAGLSGGVKNVEIFAPCGGVGKNANQMPITVGVKKKLQKGRIMKKKKTGGTTKWGNVGQPKDRKS